jgi:hypothetical protein
MKPDWQIRAEKSLRRMGYKVKRQRKVEYFDWSTFSNSMYPEPAYCASSKLNGPTGIARKNGIKL